MEQLQLSAVRVRWQDGILVLAVSGELDVLTAARLDRKLAVLAAAGHSRIVLDVAALVFCDACGLRVLIKASNRAAAVLGWFRLVGALPRLHLVLGITRLTRVLPTFESLANALEPDAAFGAANGSYGMTVAEADVLP
jgi:anti-sigma B factor antagonist